MKNGTFALYMGKEYEAGRMPDGKIVLRSDDPKDEKNGFALYQRGGIIKYIKSVEKREVEELYKITLAAKYKGYECFIIDQKDDRLLIHTTNMLHESSLELGMERAVDKGIYEKWINKEEADIRVDKEIL
jgi:hypothetical protein